jgi:hypothetical protein
VVEQQETLELHKAGVAESDKSAFGDELELEQIALEEELHKPSAGEMQDRKIARYYF